MGGIEGGWQVELGEVGTQPLLTLLVCALPGFPLLNFKHLSLKVRVFSTFQLVHE